MTTRYLSPWAFALTLSVSTAAFAQEPGQRPETAGQPAPPATVQPAPDAVQKTVPGPAQRPDPKLTKPEPARKGAIQNAEATKAEEKGSTSNLGTDVVAVRQRIENALHSDPTLSGASLTINVTDDTVEITGVANNGRERTAARRIVQSFAGNLRVKDRITVAGVRPPSADANSQINSATQPRAQTAETESDTLAKPESDQVTAPKKANKPKKEPAKDGDKSDEPRNKQ